MKGLTLLFFSSIVFSAVFGQANNDSLRPAELKEVLIKAWRSKDIQRLPGDQNGYLNSGRKNEVINLAGVNSNTAIKTGRQIFSKVPGVFVYDMDGSGNQLNISTRGLDPHRSWEFNIRQNGIITNSDMYGYPASHYSAPLESFEKIEIIRGTGSLQYGAQFGGMINFVTKKPDSLKAFTLESINSAGSYNLLSSFNAVSGTYKKFSYYAYYHRRHSDGYRSNGRSDARAEFAQVNYALSSKASLKLELGHSTYQYQIPGPLTDSMFNADPRQSTRNRNYFSPDIYIPSLTFNYSPSAMTKVIVTASGVWGKRSSVQLDAFADVPDSINRSTGLYKNRQVDIDGFNSRSIELRLLHDYQVNSLQGKLVTGIVYMNNDLHRRQLGKGTTGTDYDLTLVEPGFGRDIHFKTKNFAFFAENRFQLTPQWAVSPGFRVERGNSAMNGDIKYYTVNPLPTTIKHHFVLPGISTEYRFDEENIFYAGFSQAYRPVIFKDIIPASVYEQVDKNLKDAFGYNAEAGFRGRLLNYLQYDISYFRLKYDNRLGTLVMMDSQNQPYTFRTNTGNTLTNGLEIFIQYKVPLTAYLAAGLFSSTSYMDAKYVSGEVSSGGLNKALKGNRIESVPEWISRNGLEVSYKGFSSTVLYNYTSSTFSDALNSVLAPANGARGLTPGYSICDFNAAVRVNPMFTIRAGVNNILDKQYFTKRPTFYPGPGIWPSDGRNAYVTLTVKV